MQVLSSWPFGFSATQPLEHKPTNQPQTLPGAWYSHIGQSGAEVLVNVGLENRVEMLELDVSYQ